MSPRLDVGPRVWLGLAAVLIVLGAGVIWFGTRSVATGTQIESFATLPEGAPLDGQTFAGGPLTWDVTEGEFRAQGGGVGATAGDSIAVIATPSAPRQIDVAFDGIGDGSGIVVRYLNAQNYWSIAASADFGTWSVTKRVNGVTSFVGNTSLSLYRDRPTTLTVKLEGNVIRVLVDGTNRVTVADDTLASATAVGIIGGPTDLSTVWTSFAANET